MASRGGSRSGADTNQIRLAPRAVLAGVLIAAIMAMTVVVITLGTPTAAAEWIGGTSTFAATGMAIRAPRPTRIANMLIWTTR